MKNSVFFYILILAVILLLFFVPIMLYMFKFGIGLWGTHDDWALMGTALGGIYGPITSVITCLILFIQIKTQREDKYNQKGMVSFLETKAIFTLSLNEIYNIFSSQEKDVQSLFERIALINLNEVTTDEILESLKEIGLSSAQSARIITEWDKLMQLKRLMEGMSFEMANLYISIIKFEIDAKFPYNIQKKLSEFVYITKRNISEMDTLNPVGTIS